MKTEHILVIRFSAIGDVAMTVPVVAMLAQQYPDVRITVLSQPFAHTLFNNIAQNVSFMGADLKSEYKGLRGLNALYRRLVAKHFTAIADLHGILRSNYLRMRFQLGGFRVAHIDKHRAGKRRLVAAKNKQLVQQPTSFQNYKDVFAQLGYPIEGNSFTSLFQLEHAAQPEIPAAIGSKPEGQTWIGIAPFAAHMGKVYPLEKMEQVISLLEERHPDCRIFLFGGRGKESELNDSLAEKHSRCINVAKVVDSMGDELSLMSNLNVMLSMDSGNMHLASLVGIPVVSVWGATHPFAGFMGWKQSAGNAVQVDLPCRPCSVYGNKPCMRGDYACLNLITPEQIVEKIEQNNARNKTE